MKAPPGSRRGRASRRAPGRRIRARPIRRRDTRRRAGLHPARDSAASPSSFLLDDDASILHVDAIPVAVLASRAEIVAVMDRIAHDLAAGLAVQRDHGGKVLALLGIVGGGRALRGRDANGTNDGGGSLHGSPQKYVESLSRSVSTPHRASRDALMSFASALSPSCSSDS